MRQNINGCWPLHPNEANPQAGLTKSQQDERTLRAVNPRCIMRNMFAAISDFKLSCPISASANSPITKIRERGNLPLVLEEKMVIELTRSDLLESWQETCALGRQRLDDLVQQAACRISNALDEDELDVSSLACDTAAFFLLALRQRGLKATSSALDVEIRFDHDHPETVEVLNRMVSH
jgi:hypothetical protein